MRTLSPGCGSCVPRLNKWTEATSKLTMLEQGDKDGNFCSSQGLDFVAFGFLVFDSFGLATQEIPDCVVIRSNYIHRGQTMRPIFGSTAGSPSLSRVVLLSSLSSVCLIPSRGNVCVTCVCCFP